MLQTEIVVESKPKLKNPVCIVGLPGIGNIGRIAIGYAISELKAKKFAELYSPYFFPFVMIYNDQIHTLRNEFYYYKNPKGRDLIMLIGDTQTYDPKGHYEIVGKILEFLKSLGCSEQPKVYGVVTDPSLIKELKGLGVSFNIGGQIGTIVGAAGLLVGLGHIYNIKGTVLLGETTGFPIITDPTAAEAVLKILEKLLKVKIDLAKLDEKVKSMHEFMKKLEDIQRQAVEQIQRGKKPEELKYIG